MWRQFCFLNFAPFGVPSRKWKNSQYSPAFAKTKRFVYFDKLFSVGISKIHPWKVRTQVWKKYSLRVTERLYVHMNLETLRFEDAGSQRGGPWSPRALKFLLWSPEPYRFTDWSPDPFLAVKPGAQRHLARSLEPSIFKFDHSSSQIVLILDYCLFVFVCSY